jgi:FkbM family methyltransferase
MRLNPFSRFRRLKARSVQDSYAQVSYSQCGEDLIIDYLFRLRGIEQPSYIDIGANHPYYLSNTARFYGRGSRGINIEPNPSLIGPFHEFRPRDVNLNVGVGDRPGEFEFFVMEDNTLSTFSAKERDFLVQNGKRQAGSVSVKVLTLSSTLSEYWGGEFPDLLTVDAEGLDFDIIRSIDFDHCYPKVICVEAADYSPTGAGVRRTELINYLTSRKYYEYANTNLNAILIRQELWEGESQGSH